MSHTVTTEIERKYEVAAEAVLPELVAAAPDGSTLGAGVLGAEAHPPVELEAIYFDTADGALARARIALRRRRGGHDAGWHVKLPAAEGRTELQWPLDAAEPGDALDAVSGAAGDAVPAEVPEAVLDAVRVHVRDRAVTPLARISTTRRITELQDAAGAVIVEIADDTVSTTDLREGTVRAWREWEAELGPAAPATEKARTALLDAVEERLLAAGAAVSPSVSKLAQALGRTGLGGPGDRPVDAAEPGETTQDAPEQAHSPGAAAAGVVRAGLAELVATVIRLDPAARADEPDAVHHLRTTVRRLRSILATHRATLGAADPAAPAEVAALRDSLSRFGAALGEVRDLEVRAEWADRELAAFERERGVDDPEARRRLVDQIRAEHAEAHRRLVATLSRVPYFRLLDALEAFVVPRPGEAATVPAAATSAGGKWGKKQKPSGGKDEGKTKTKSKSKSKSKGAGRAANRAAEPGEQRALAEKAARRVLGRESRRATRRTVMAEAALPVLDGGAAEAAHALGALHRSRKAARRLRYTAEFSAEGAAGVLGRRADDLADAAERLQDALGQHRDAALFAEFVLLTAGRADAAGESSFSYGVLYQRAIDRAREALAEADRARRHLTRAS